MVSAENLFSVTITSSCVIEAIKAVALNFGMRTIKEQTYWGMDVIGLSLMFAGNNYMS